MLSEASGVFLGIREIIGKKTQGTFALVNNILFFLSYTAFRILHFPFCLRNHLINPYQFNWEGWTQFNIVLHYVLTTAFVGICCLNLFWYRIIVKMLIKLFKNEKVE